MIALVACRVLHIAAACTSLGGLFYARAVLWPSLRRLPARTRERFLRVAMRRFAPIKWAGVSVIAVTGVLQWWLTFPHQWPSATYLALFGLKMVGGIGLFATTLLLALPLPRLAAMQRRRGLFSGLNIGFGSLILTGASLMRYAPY